MRVTRSDGAGGAWGVQGGTWQEAADSGSGAGGARRELEVKPFKVMSDPQDRDCVFSFS